MREMAKLLERLSTPARPWEAGKALQASPGPEGSGPPPLGLLTPTRTAADGEAPFGPRPLPRARGGGGGRPRAA